MSRLEARRRRIGPLETLFVEGSPDGPTVVIFHGYGADMADLAPLAGAIQAPKGTNWIFPNGHITIPLGGHFEGRAWFPISVSELERASMLGQPVDFSTIVPPGMSKARNLALKFVESLVDDLGVRMDRLVLGGFSQGGMLATDLTLRLQTPPAGLVILSGTLVNSQEWRELAPQHKGFEFFQSHGRLDSVLSFPVAKKLEALLLESGWVGKLQAFEGAHEIPPEVLIQAGAYLRKRLSAGGRP